MTTNENPESVTMIETKLTLFLISILIIFMVYFAFNIIKYTSQEIWFSRLSNNRVLNH